MIDNDGVTVSVVVEVDAPTAFDVFISDVDLWWRKDPYFRFTPGRQGTMRFEPGDGGRLLEVYDELGEDVFEVGRILVWNPGVELAFEWRARNYEPGERTEVRIGFEDIGYGTRVTLRHVGWSRLRPGHPATHGLVGDEFHTMIGGAWSVRLREFRGRVRARGS